MLNFLFLFSGMNAVIAQTLLLRGMLAVFQGNELSLGIIFSHWMLGTAFGSFAAGRRRTADIRRTRILLGMAFAGAGLFLLSAFLLLTGFRRLLPVFAGEGISLWTTFWCSFILLFPVSACVGAQFSLGVRILQDGQGSAPSAKVYAFESAGYLLGGVLFTFLFLRLFDAATMAVLLAVLGLFIAFLATGARLTVMRVLASIALCTALFFALNSPVQRYMLARLYPGYQILEIKDSPCAQLAVVEREHEFHLLSDGVPVLTLPHADAEKEEEFGILPLLYAGTPKKVLLVGGGNYLPAILKYPVTRVDYVERDPLLLRLEEKYGAAAFKDPRVRPHYTDGRLFIRDTAETYDAILLAVPAPVTLAMNRFFTAEAFSLMKRRLSNGGILALSLPGSGAYVDDNTARLAAVTGKTLSAVFPAVKMVPGDDGTLVIAGTAPLADAAKIKESFSTLGLTTAFLSPASLEYRLDARREQQYSERVKAEFPAAASNRDTAPAGLAAALRYWEAIFAPGIARFYAGFLRCSWLLWVAGFLWFFSGKAGYTGTAFISGTAAMSLQMISMWGLQIARGNIYYWAGLLTATFMAGAAAGALLVQRKYLRSVMSGRLVVVELLFFLWTAAALPLVKLAGAAWPAFFVFSFGTGLLLGLEFPLLTLLKTGSAGNEGAVAGTMYAADLLGGWLAALAVGALLLPLWGIDKAVLLILLLKATSLRWALSSNT